MVMLDYKEAFDTICHKVLLQKLNHYGIRDAAHDLIVSFLFDRKQFVSHQQHKSKPEMISYDIPQGSNLGSLRFPIYIKDLLNSINSDVKLFTNDACLFLHASDPLILEPQTNIALDKC